MKSYLLQRTFRVKYGEAVTQLKEINSRVPQGSVLGPVLYLLYADLSVTLPIPQLQLMRTTQLFWRLATTIQKHPCVYKKTSFIQKWPKKWRIRVNGANLYR